MGHLWCSMDQNWDRFGAASIILCGQLIGDMSLSPRRPSNIVWRVPLEATYSTFVSFIVSGVALQPARPFAYLAANPLQHGNFARQGEPQQRNGVRLSLHLPWQPGRIVRDHYCLDHTYRKHRLRNGFGTCVPCKAGVAGSVSFTREKRYPRGLLLSHPCMPRQHTPMRTVGIAIAGQLDRQRWNLCTR